jgi:hypothetical protein
MVRIYTYMNGKKAKKLRRIAKVLEADKTVYEEGTESMWGSLPKLESGNIDVKKLRKAVVASRVPKFRGQGNGKEFRYIIGKPIKLGECNRKLYQAMKK